MRCFQNPQRKEKYNDKKYIDRYIPDIRTDLSPSTCRHLTTVWLSFCFCFFERKKKGKRYRQADVLCTIMYINYLYLYLKHIACPCDRRCPCSLVSDYMKCRAPFHDDAVETSLSSIYSSLADRLYYFSPTFTLFLSTMTTICSIFIEMKKRN